MHHYTCCYSCGIESSMDMYPTPAYFKVLTHACPTQYTATTAFEYW